MNQYLKKEYTNPLFLAIVLIFIHFSEIFRNYTTGTHFFLCFVHLFLFFCMILNQKRTNFNPLVFFTGFSILFTFMMVIYSPSQPLMYSLCVLLYGATFHQTSFAGFFWIFFLSIILFLEYWFYLFAILSFLYLIILSLIKSREGISSSIFFFTGFLFFVLLIFPLFHLMFQSTPQTLILMLKEKSFQSAVFNSLFTSLISALLITLFGIPLAYAMVRIEFPGKKFIDGLIDIPILIPQTIAGIALLNILGPKTTLGKYFIQNWNISISGTFIGIILCQMFVSTPYVIRSAMNGFERVPPELENLSRTLGAGRLSTFFRVSLPLSLSAVFDGFILAWARSISEFGSVMILAQYPSTIPVYTYEHYVRYGLAEARPISVLLVIICLWIFIGLRFIKTFTGRKNASII